MWTSLEDLIDFLDDVGASRAYLMDAQPVKYVTDLGMTKAGDPLSMKVVKRWLKKAIPSSVLRQMRWGVEIVYKLDTQPLPWVMCVRLSTKKTLSVELWPASARDTTAANYIANYQSASVPAVSPEDARAEAAAARRDEFDDELTGPLPMPPLTETSAPVSSVRTPAPSKPTPSPQKSPSPPQASAMSRPKRPAKPRPQPTATAPSIPDDEEGDAPTLMFTAAQLMALAPQPASATPALSRGGTALVMTFDPNALKTIEDALGEFGYSVQVCEGSEMAEERLKYNDYQLTVLAPQSADARDAAVSY